MYGDMHRALYVVVVQASSLHDSRYAFAMSRLPFDPSKMAAAKPKPAAEEESRPLTVSELASQIDAAVRRSTPGSVRVVGEVTGFRDRTHWYFDIKDAEAIVACVAFSSVARRVGFELKDGLQVVVKGRLEYYAKGGKISFIVEKIEPVGAGALDLKRKQLIEELRKLGWLEPQRKRRLPLLPRKIAVVTSRSAAALQDVIDTVRRRCPSVELVLADTRVQGADAAAEIADTINLVSKFASSLGIDAVLVTRGGGSTEDMWCFNERIVAEAIVKCSVPVVAAIGHETDVTIAELVADERAATPTQAAMRLTPERKSLLHQLDVLHDRVRGSVQEVCAEERRRIGHLVKDLRAGQIASVQSSGRRLLIVSQRLERASPSAQLASLTARLRSVASRLPMAMAGVLRQADTEGLSRSLMRAGQVAIRDSDKAVESLAARLRSVNPLAVLDRGYSITRDAQGRIVKSVNQVSRGEQLQTRVGDGVIHSTVHDETAGEPIKLSQPPASPPPSAPARKKRDKSEGTPGLFGE